MRHTPAEAGGQLLAAATALIAKVRDARKPLHPYGDIWVGHVRRTGTADHPSGVPWLDTPGEDEVVARVSTGIGMPDGWPDVLGLALRIPSSEGPADLPLSTTGAGRLTRFLAAPTRCPAGSTFSTLLPHRGPKGSVLVAAHAHTEQSFDLAWATPTGDWHRFGRLELQRTTDQSPTFDPIGNLLPRLDQHRWATLLRAPAYRRARASRGDVSRRR